MATARLVTKAPDGTVMFDSSTFRTPLLLLDINTTKTAGSAALPAASLGGTLSYSQNTAGFEAPGEVSFSGGNVNWTASGATSRLKVYVL